MRWPVVCALALLAARATDATHPCAVLSAQKEGNARARALIPEGREIIKEFITFHEYFSDAQDEFSRLVDDMYDTYKCKPNTA